MFFKYSLNKRIHSVHTFFKDDLLLTINNLLKYSHSDNINLTWLRDMLSEFKSKQEDDFFSYKLNEIDDGTDNTYLLSISIIMFKYPETRTLDMVIPIKNYIFDKIEPYEFIKSIERFLIDLSYEYNISLIDEKTMPPNVGDNSCFNMIKKNHKVSCVYHDFIGFLYNRHPLTFDSSSAKRVKDKFLSLLSLIDTEVVSNEIKKELLTDFDNDLQFVHNLLKHMSTLEKNINIYLDIQRAFIKSCFDRTLYSSHNDFPIL